MWAAITALCTAVAAYFTLLIKTAPFRYHEQADAAEDEIYRLRKSADAADQLRADLLGLRIVRIRRQADKLADIPTANPSSGGGGANPDG